MIIVELGCAGLIAASTWPSFTWKSINVQNENWESEMDFDAW